MAIEAIFGRLDERGLFKGIEDRCRRMFVTVDDIVGRSRTKAVVKARHTVWLWMHDELGLSWPEVAHIFGRKHDNVIQARGKRNRINPVQENRVAEKVAKWLEADAVEDDDPRAFVDVVDRARMAGLIRDGAWQ